jgi:hypothetical protein
MKTWYSKIFASVSDAVDLSRISENTLLPISLNCVSIPTPFPKLITDFHVFFG